MKTIHRNEGFLCAVCGTENGPSSGTCRDHCTACLFSRHVDAKLPGDRASTCLGMLRPTHATLHAKKGIMIHYVCEKCGATHQNKAAEDDNGAALDALVLAANKRIAGL